MMQVNQMKRILLGLALWLGFIASAMAQAPSWVQSGPSTGTAYPAGAQPFVAAATAAGTSATVTITASPVKTVYVCSVYMAEAAGTAAAGNGTMTNMSGLTGAATTLNFLYPSSAFAATANASLTQTFNPCIPAFAVNQSVVVTTPTATAATTSDVNVTGYYF
jgi:hypothetical protein